MNPDRWSGFEDYAMDERVYLVFGVVIVILLVLVILLAATTLFIRFRNISRSSKYLIQENKWEPLILKYMFGEITADEIHNAVDPEEELRFINIIIRHLQELRGSEADQLIGLTDPYLHKIVKQLSDKSPARRARALKTLSTLAIKRYPLEMLRGLNDPSPLVAMVVARSMAQHGQTEYLKDIMDQINRFANWNRGYLVTMIASFGSSASQTLADILINQSCSNFARGIAADALAELNYIHITPLLPQILGTTPDAELLAALLRLASKIGNPSIMDSIRPFLSHPDYFVRGPAYRAVGFLGDKTDRPLLELAVRDDSPWVARYAAIALIKIGGRGRLEAMIEQGHKRSALLQEILAGGIAA